MAAAEPLSWRAAVTSWAMPVPLAVLLVAAALAYLVAARRAGGWRWRDTTWFLLGLAVTAVAAGGSVNAYSHVLFTAHMTQHLLLIMVAPTLLILGRPLELLRRATGWTAGRVLRTLTHPMFTFPFYTAVVVGTHLSPFQQSALTSSWVHGLEELLYLASGYLLLLPVIGTDSGGRRPAHLMRLIVLLAGMVVDTIVGLALLMSASVPFPGYAETGRTWGPSPLDDLHWGGALMWVGGDLLMAALAVIVITRWVSGTGGSGDLGPWLEAARRSALGQGETAQPGGNIDDDEDALKAYNAMLARLADPEQRRRGQDSR